MVRNEEGHGSGASGSWVDELPCSDTHTLEGVGERSEPLVLLLKTACPLRTSPSCASYVLLPDLSGPSSFFAHTKWFD